MRVTRDYRILPLSEIPKGPLYVGNAKAGANVFVPTAMTAGETVVDLPDTHLVGGDPTVMPIMDGPEPVEYTGYQAVGALAVVPANCLSKI